MPTPHQSSGIQPKDILLCGNARTQTTAQSAMVTALPVKEWPQSHQWDNNVDVNTPPKFFQDGTKDGGFRHVSSLTVLDV